MQQKYLQCDDVSCVTTATQLHHGLTEGKEWSGAILLFCGSTFYCAPGIDTTPELASFTLH